MKASSVQSYIVRVLVIGLFGFTSGCGMGSPAQSEVSVDGRNRLSQEVNTDPHRIPGVWKFIEITDRIQPPSAGLEFVRSFLLAPHSNLLLTIGSDKANLTLQKELPQGLLCNITLYYTLSYCCPEMDRIFLRRTEGPPYIAPTGCTDSVFSEPLDVVVRHLEAFILPHYHFIKGAAADSLRLMGPYSNSPAHPSDNFTRDIDLILF